MLRLRTLGGLAIDEDARTLDGTGMGRRRLALLACLAAVGPRGVSRDRLLAYFWPESDAERARHALNQALHALRRELRADALFLGAAELRLNPEAMASDVAEFESAVGAGDLERAASLYAGPFLDGFYLSDAPEFERWVDGERARLALAFRRALETLAARATNGGQHQQAVVWWRRLAALDPLSGPLALGLMQALAAAGDRAGALQFARVHETLLREELDAAPDPAMVSLAEKLREADARERKQSGRPAAGTVPAITSDAALSAADQLFVDRLQTALASHYEIEHKLARSSLATAYQVRDLRRGRTVTLKVLHPAVATMVGARRFVTAIEPASRLRHPHIVPLLDFGEASGLLFYVLERVEGETLRDRLARERQLSLGDALRIAREAATALAYAHERGVIHRDIAPKNIVLVEGRAVISDFGVLNAVSTAVGESSSGSALTLGSPAYMSPEQVAGEQRLDGRSDIYSLGCVLYQMLAGAPPFAGPTAQAALTRRLFEPVPPLRAMRDTVPEAVDKLVLRALARVPADRFASAAELRDALARLEPERAGAPASVARDRGAV
jgi:serine/threonine-protein kinase